ncbi:MAG: DUF3343 domain-containing protein [Heliobacteriaceae bacterium]|nr:DUF3343 domain-containing protein [Heliobacteriaceae bacterium]
MPDKEMWWQRTYPLVTFTSTQEAIAGEQTGKDCLIPCILLPVPREISEGCGLALRVRPADFPRFLVCLKQKGIGVRGYYWNECDHSWERFTKFSDTTFLSPPKNDKIK